MADWFLHGAAAEHVAVDERGFLYGDGLFETIAIRDGEPRLWQYHMDRLEKGGEKLGIRIPSAAQLSEGIIHALQHSEVQDRCCVAKIVVSAGAGARGYGRALIASPTILFGVYPASPPPLESYRDGIDTVLCQTRLAVHSPTAGLKTLNRLEQVLARSEFVDSGEFEGLTMDADDNIICGTMSNVFFVTDNAVSTPPLIRCGVEGVMRRYVIATLQNQGIETLIKTTHSATMKAVDEVFVTNSQIGVIPVRSCAKMRWPVGETTRKVMTMMADNGVAECR